MISWVSMKYKFVALSMVKVEYIVASMVIYEEIWLRKLFGDLFEQVLHMKMIYCNNTSGI